MPRAHLREALKNLNRQLSRRRNHQRPDAILPSPLLPPQRFDQRHNVRQRLPASRFRRAEDVSSAQRVRQRRSLYSRHLLKLTLPQRRLRRLTYRQVRKLPHSHQRRPGVAVGALTRRDGERVVTARGLGVGDDGFDFRDFRIDARARGQTLRRFRARLCVFIFRHRARRGRGRGRDEAPSEAPPPPPVELGKLLDARRDERRAAMDARARRASKGRARGWRIVTIFFE